MEDNETLDFCLKVIYEHDSEGIEDARDCITMEEAIILEKEYWKITDWKTKACLVMVVQDFQLDELKNMMTHALKIPDIGGDYGTEVISISVSYLKKDFSLFPEVLGSYEYSKQKAREILNIEL